MDELTKIEFDRVHDEDNRQNKRIDKLEDSINQIQSISLSVEKLAINMQHMLEELKDQGCRLAKLENEPAEAWNKTKLTIVTAIVSGLAGVLISALLHSAM